MGGGIGMGNTCKPLAVSFQCMTKSTTNKKKKKREKNKKIKKKERLNLMSTKNLMFTLKCKFVRIREILMI